MTQAQPGPGRELRVRGFIGRRGARVGLIALDLERRVYLLEVEPDKWLSRIRIADEALLVGDNLFVVGPWGALSAIVVDRAVVERSA